MLLTLSKVLSHEEAVYLCSILPASGSGATAEAAAVVTKALWAHPLFQLGVQPRKLSEPNFRWYDNQCESISSVDEAMIGEKSVMRADIGVIIFLSDESSYEGGEVLLDSGYGTETVKGDAGDCVVYAASLQHGFARVTSGTSYTAELWAQSLIRAPMQRQILYDIGYSLHQIELFGKDLIPDTERLQKCQRNLIRLWAEP